MAPEELHAKQREDEDEQEEEEEQGHDGAQRVHQGDHEVPQRRPVPAQIVNEKSRIIV